MDIPNLAPKTVPKEEVINVSLRGLYEDPDLVLITQSSITKLRNDLSKLVSMYQDKLN